MALPLEYWEEHLSPALENWALEAEGQGHCQVVFEVPALVNQASEAQVLANQLLGVQASDHLSWGQVAGSRLSEAQV